MIYNIIMLLFSVVSYKVRPPRLVSYACLYTTTTVVLNHLNTAFALNHLNTAYFMRSDLNKLGEVYQALNYDIYDLLLKQH